MLAALSLLFVRPELVSVDMGGARVRDIVASIAEQSGRKLETSAKVGDEILIVRAQNVTPDDLLARIATVEDAEWKTIGSTPTLVRSSETERQEAALETARRTSDLKRFLTERFRADSEKDGINPQDGVLRRAVFAIGAERLARIPMNTTAVWASSPTPVQHLWTGSVSGIVRGFMEDSAKAAKEEGQDIEAPVLERGTKVVTPPDEDEGGPIQPVIPINTQTVARVLVKVHYDQSQVYAVTVIFFAANGKSLQDFTEAINLVDVGEEESPKPLQNIPQPAQQYRRIFLNASMREASLASPAALKKIQDPTVYEPLSLFTADYLQAMYPKDRALVASVSDLTFEFILESEGGFSENSFRSFLKVFCIPDLSQPGWTLLRPAFPIQNRATRSNRASMAEFYRSHIGEISTDIRSMAAFVLTQPTSFYNTIARTYGNVLNPYALTIGATVPLRVFGTLTPDQQTLFLQGGSLSYRALPFRAQEEIFDWIFNQRVWNYLGDSAEEDANMEASDAFPDGRLTNSVLTVTGEPRDILIPLYDNKPLADGRTYLPTSIGSLLERESTGHGRLPGKSIEGYLLGKRTFYKVHFTSPALNTAESIADLHVDRNAPSVSFEELPAGLRESILASRKRFRDNQNAARAGIKP